MGTYEMFLNLSPSNKHKPSVDMCADVLSPCLTPLFLPFQTPEPGAHLPGEDEDKQPSPSPAEPEEQGWSLETDHGDLETLFHQMESQWDTKTDPFESISDTESMPGDLAGGVCPPPSGTLVDRIACWECPDDPATTPQEQHLTGVPEHDLKGERDLSLEFTEQSYKSGFGAFADITAEEKAEHIPGCVASLGQELLLVGDPYHTEGCSQGATGSYSLQQAKMVTAQDLKGFSVISLQKSRSESCLYIPGVWPFLLWCCKLGCSWPHIHNRARGPGLPLRGPLVSTAPLGARAKMGSVPGPAESTDLSSSQPCSDVPASFL